MSAMANTKNIRNLYNIRIERTEPEIQFGIWSIRRNASHRRVCVDRFPGYGSPVSHIRDNRHTGTGDPEIAEED